MTLTRTSSYGSPQEKLAILLEQYQVLRHDIADTADREQRQLKHTCWRVCWDAIQTALSSRALAQEKLATLVALYMVLRCEVSVAAPRQKEALRTQMRACWDAIQAALSSPFVAQEQFTTLISLYQVLNYELATADSRQQEAIQAHLRVTGDRIWVALAKVLTRLGRKWLRSQMAKNLRENHASYANTAAVVHAMALSAFSDILEQLPTLDIHPRKNLLGYLLTIAHRSLYKQNGLYRPDGPDSARKSRPTQEPITSGSLAAAMWQAGERPAEPSSDDFKNHVETNTYVQQNAAALWSYITQTLSPTEQTILKRRLQDPPVEFAIIAAELDPNWSANRVRVQFHRAIEKIRAYVEVRVLDAMRDQQCAAEVWALVRRSLEPIDETILRIRWRTYPPVDFAAIAGELGEGYTVAIVHERHHCALTSIFAHLRSLGLVDLG